MAKGRFEVAGYEADALPYRPDILRAVMKTIWIINTNDSITLLVDV